MTSPDLERPPKWMRALFFHVTGALFGLVAAYYWWSGDIVGTMVFGSLSVVFSAAGLWTLLARVHPAPRDLRWLSPHTVWYHTVSPAPPLSLSIPLTCASIVAAVISPLLLRGEFLLAIFPPFGLSVLASLLLPPTLGLGCVRALCAWGRTVLLLSLGYCEVEVIADGDVKISGFRELRSFPIEHEEVPGLRMIVGYFPPGVHKVRVPDRGFLFLRTRGFCLLHGPWELPGDEREAFRLARSWEKFSMVCAALCLRDGRPPDSEHVRGIMKHVKNNSRKGLRVTYFGVEFRWGKLLFGSSSLDYVILAMIPLILLVWYTIGLPQSTTLRSLVSVALPLLGSTMLALPIAWRNRRVVRSGRWYLLLNERVRVQGMLPSSWMDEDVSFLVLWKLLNALEED